MFDAHRHFTEEQTPYDALFATANQDQWHLLISKKEPSLGAAGALASEKLPPLDILYEFLQQNLRVQVGEVGLDRRFGHKEEQVTFLLAVLDMAYELERSVTLHVVQSDGLLLSCLKASGKHLPRMLWHGFASSLETAKDAVKMGCILSMGPNLFRTKHIQIIQQLSTLPFALETDYEEKEKTAYPVFLKHHYERFSKASGIGMDALIRNNYAIRAILANNQASR